MLMEKGILDICQDALALLNHDQNKVFGALQ
jgi:hypothetical protein